MNVILGEKFPSGIQLERDDGLDMDYVKWLPFGTDVQLDGRFDLTELKAIIKCIETQIAVGSIP